jgi:hypothetical protein
MTAKRKYLDLASAQPTDWLVQCMAQPSAHMRPIHVALIALALRNRRSR